MPEPGEDWAYRSNPRNWRRWNPPFWRRWNIPDAYLRSLGAAVIIGISAFVLCLATDSLVTTGPGGVIAFVLLCAAFGAMVVLKRAARQAPGTLKASSVKRLIGIIAAVSAAGGLWKVYTLWPIDIELIVMAAVIALVVLGRLHKVWSRL